MRCHDAKDWLSARRDGNVQPSMASALQEHLTQCSECRAFERQQRQIEGLLKVSTPSQPLSVSTETIMRAVQQQRRITEQLEDIRKQQQCRVQSLRKVGAASAALGIFTLSSLPLLILAIMIVQTDLVMNTLSLFTGIIDMCIILAQYFQAELTLVARDNWLLSGIAFAIVIMAGMWLRLMRPSQEA